MKERFPVYLPLMFLFFVISCKEKKQVYGVVNVKNELALLKAIAEDRKKNPDPEHRLAFWNGELHNVKYKNIPVLLSSIHYNIAGIFYGMHQIDSLKIHMQLAWELMEGQSGYQEEKVLLYSGLGNVAHTEQKLHQENYYYNRAGQMLLSDTSIHLTPKQETSIYFSAAQSSEHLGQFANAFNMNRAAIALLPQLPEDYPAQFRAYSQMAACYYQSDGNLDSLYSYIHKMEDLYREHPDENKARFLYDRKALYFARINNIDSSLYYHRLRLALDEAEEQEFGKNAQSVVSANLYNSYTDMVATFLKYKQTDSAYYYLQQCKTFDSKYPGQLDKGNIVLYRQNLVHYLLDMKHYELAEKELDTLLLQNKELYETENARAVAEMSTLFQLQAKDRSIHNLNETVDLTQSRLQKNRLWLTISALAAMLAIAVALLLYYIQRQRKLRTENEKTLLQQQLLRTQMEPHFIFNTLSALQSFVRFDEKEKTMKYLNQFSRLLRSSLELSREKLVPLAEEIETLENYLSLQKMRYDNAFAYNINCEEDIYGLLIPPMLIQPFVENAIVHGIDPNDNKGIITIDFTINNDNIIVTIRDNGKGIQATQIAQKHKSLATTISKERLAMMAKETGIAAGIAIHDGTVNGTVVVLTIPIYHNKGIE